jgi:hypothetical protein
MTAFCVHLLTFSSGIATASGFLWLYGPLYWSGSV